MNICNVVTEPDVPFIAGHLYQHQLSNGGLACSVYIATITGNELVNLSTGGKFISKEASRYKDVTNKYCLKEL